MKNIFLGLLVSVMFLACKETKYPEKVLIPRDLKSSEDFNESPKSATGIFNLVKIDSGRDGNAERFIINFRDTLIVVKLKSKVEKDIFLNPRFINSQKTAVLAQLDDSTGNSFYIFSAKGSKLEAIELRHKLGSETKTSEIKEVSRSSFLVGNDFLITNINGKVYPIKRQFESEPINGKIFMLSNDGSTLVFLTPNSFYQYNYLTNDSYNLPVDSKILNNKAALFKNVQRDFSWFKNAKGTLFLKQNDDNRIVDIKEFKH